MANIFKAVGCYIDVSVERKQKETLPAGACSRVKTITSSQDIKNYFLQLLVVLIQFPVSLFPELHMFRCCQLQVVFPSGCDLTVTVTSTQRQRELSHLKDLRLWQLDLVDKTSTQLYMRHTDLISINQENISLCMKNHLKKACQIWWVCWLHHSSQHDLTFIFLLLNLLGCSLVCSEEDPGAA